MSPTPGSTTPGPVTLRPARPEDESPLGRMGAALVRLHHTLDPQRFMAPGPGTQAGYGGWLVRESRRAQALVLVAERDGQVVGYSYATVEGRDWNALLEAHAELHDLWVEEAARGGGVGSLLAEEMVRQLIARGVPRVLLKTASGNATAQRLFTRLGWRPTMVEMTRETANSDAKR